MSTESEVKLARYRQIEREADEFGRIIGVRRLKPSEQTKLQGMTSDLTGFDESEDVDGNKVAIPHRMPLMVAAAVCELDNHPIPFPKTRGELDAMFDRLDREGLVAAVRALGRLGETTDQVDDPLDAAKN
jgi:hypothetical protein